MKILVVLLVLGTAVTAFPIEDPVIAKFDDNGLRYQYMSGPDGPVLVDLWLKISDVEESKRYNPEENNRYLLFTRKNQLTGEQIPYGSEPVLLNSNFDVRKKTVVLIHGWMNTPTSDFNVELIRAYLYAEDVNVIMVDWSIGADANYLVAMQNVIKSAEHVSKFVNWLLDVSGGDLANYHVIGHSLGAHQAGILGRHLKGKVAYLTGLDPAMPGWITHDQAISKEVAIYTEVIHTDVGYSGLLRPAGHVDFYPNGGNNMPGCEDRSCSHHRCIFYMAESLRYSGFTGKPCDNVFSAMSGDCNGTDTLKMGGTKPKTGSSGIYYLVTNAQAPFSLF